MPANHSKLLLHVIEGINRTVELKELLQKCMDAASIVMDSEASSLMLLDDQTGELNVSIPTGPVQDNIKGISIPKDKGIGGWVLQNNQPYYSNDVTKSDLFWKDLTDDFTTKNLICVPLQIGNDDPFGVIQAINRKDGAEFDDEDITVFSALAMHIAIAIDRARKYEAMMNKLEDREVQLSEIHHRLKNNLATICALIELDITDLDDVKSKDVLKVTGSRIRSVSDVHSLLYDQKRLGELDLGNYLESVAKNIERIFSEPGKEITIKTDFEEVFVDANKSMVTGLIINELLINAFQHAFNGLENGEILLSLKKEQDHIFVRVVDNGIGKANTEPDPASKSYGTFIVQALAKKINGDLTVNARDNSGTEIVLTFNK